MKKLILIALMNIIWGTAFAAPITTYTDGSTFSVDTGAVAIAPTVTGFASPIPDGYILDLINPTQTVTFTFVEGLTAFGAWWFNAPYDVGTGMIATTSNGDVMVIAGPGVYTNAFWGFVSDIPFTSVEVSTALANGVQARERLYVKNMVGADGTVPEPGAFMLLGSGLLVLACVRRMWMPLKGGPQ
jgi:hypothetical protein